MSGATLTTNDGTVDQPVKSASSQDAGAPAGGIAVGSVVRDVINASAMVLFGVNGFRQVSAANTQVQNVIDLHQLHDILDIQMTTSGGTASVTVEGSVDNANFITLDTLAAAASIVKHYNNTTVGAGVALTPLSFRYVRITISAAGVGNTTTTTVTAK